MAIKYQFNKISMQSLRKQLKVRESALPTIKSKEAALRLTVKKQNDHLKVLNAQLEEKLRELALMERLWEEFPGDIFDLKDVVLQVKKIAGVKTPVLEDVNYEIREYSAFANPVWLASGIEVLKDLTRLIIDIEVARKKLEILEYARKKTTQKVNLYEKVQIPAFSDAILKIKRYLEDVDNLEKSGQKITKQKQMARGGGL